MKETIKNILLKVPKLIRDFLMEDMKRELEEIKRDNREIHKSLCENELHTMRIAICSEEMPLSERISIGQKYIEKGGNGAVKVLVHVLEERYEKEILKGEKK